MGRFLEKEKERYAELKVKKPFLFSEAARAPGVYAKRPRDFCLPTEHAEENLFLGIRSDTLQYFANYGIEWHDEECGKPSNHLCDSQVCCVNFLAPFSRQPDALLALLRPVYADIVEALPVEDGRYVAFEWIGQRNYLGEAVRGMRTRGEYCTSADAVVRFRERDGTVRVVLIEWKYTEDYEEKDRSQGKSGATRLSVYRPLYDSPNCPLDRGKIGKYENLFFEPFYQLFRQQLLAHEMESAGEMGANKVNVLHLVPDANKEYQTVTSPGLRGLGATADDVWSRLVVDPRSFVACSIESLFRPFPAARFPALRGWWAYMGRRYPWAI